MPEPSVSSIAIYQLRVVRRESARGAAAARGQHNQYRRTPRNPSEYIRLELLPADIAAVNPDRKRTIGRGKFVPASLAALDETKLVHSHPTASQNGSLDAELKRVCGWLSAKLV